jgi:segregation and condensation protein B
VEQYAGSGLELKQVASGFRLQVKPAYETWVSRLWDQRPPRYSRALLETLALIAYRQPITRGEIEDIRGVSVSTNIIRTLQEREWVRPLGHKDVPGKPALYGTTRAFLDYFNLKTLNQLPTLAEIRDLDQYNPELALVDTGETSDTTSLLED